MSDVSDWLTTADRFADWSGVAATVLGLGSAGFAAADALLRVGANVRVLEATSPTSTDHPTRKRADVLDALGASVLLGAAFEHDVTTDLLVPSPGLRPTPPVGDRRSRGHNVERRAAGVAATSARKSLARGHRHQRQDHDRAARRRHAAAGRPSQPGCWQHWAADVPRRSLSSHSPTSSSWSYRATSSTSRRTSPPTQLLC